MSKQEAHPIVNRLKQRQRQGAIAALRLGGKSGEDIEKRYLPLYDKQVATRQAKAEAVREALLS